MRNTPPKSPIEQRETAELIEDLCIALRDVGGSWFPDYDEHVPKKIEEVQRLHAELMARNVDLSARISRLTEETSWRMEDLLRDCLSYPKAIPYVRDKDGVRRALRCPLCHRGEIPDRFGVWMCNNCLLVAIESVRSRVPAKGLILFRTYNESKRCKHADSETVLMAFDDEYDFQMGTNYCMRCLVEEQERRKKL
jgi:hypothetical protein